MVSETQHEQIRCNRIAKQTCGQTCRIEQNGMFRPCRRTYPETDFGARERKVRIPRKLARDLLVHVHDHMRAPVLDRIQGEITCSHQRIATKHHIGRACIDTHCSDVALI